jgi:hypothetical protein
MTWWMWYAAGMATVVAALMLAALVSRWFRVPAAHRAGIDEDEDDPEPVTELRIHPNLYPNNRPMHPVDLTESPSMGLGPPPTYPERPEEHTR